MAPGILVNGDSGVNGIKSHSSKRNLNPQDDLRFGLKLKPRTVAKVDELQKNQRVRITERRGRTLMSGLGDAHTHFTWNNSALDKLGDVGVEEHTLMTAKDYINAGDIPGPRYLANGKEMAVRKGELAAGITVFADGPLEMREVIRHHAKIGVDQIKLSMSGEEITYSKSAQDSYYTDEETAACVDEAHRLDLRLCSHARVRDRVKMCVKHGVDVVYHANYIDEKGMDTLEKNKHKHVVAPGINWLWATVYEAAPFRYSFENAEAVGYMKELQIAIRALKEMHHRGITVLSGGNYGFAWTPHGTYARDIEHFVKLLDFTLMELIIAALAGVAKLFMEEDELGKVREGYVILVDGDPLKDIAVLQEHDKLNMITINGRIHKALHRDLPRHQKEFNKSGYDASDKVDKPSHQVIFAKRRTNFTQSLDYEGKIGSRHWQSRLRHRRKERNGSCGGAYKIINDVTAREKQRDYKQFYIAKSADTFCPMGRIAVPASQVPKVLRVQTHVNVQKRQDGTTEDLIFSVGSLIKTLSESTTLQPGGVLATGTPAGVGLFEVSIIESVSEASSIPMYNLDISCDGIGLAKINYKLINIQEVGSGTEPIVYVHGLGGTIEFHRPLISAAGLSEFHISILYDLEGHGLTLTKASSVVTMDSLVSYLAGISASPKYNIKSATLMSPSLGGLIALNFALAHPSLVKKLILIGPGPSPLPAAASEATLKRAAAVCASGMQASGVAEAVSNAATSETSKKLNPLALSAVRASLLS
ncbi:hypothetical protein OEA41_003398 [Lepraria neglecta]|uniref:Amidohydrolase-related domain-containing protein n=1 Tax=Lepraria neglecta TaxID=209136 RepID=A0AAD9Z476_9LECA|nr:hypothetical protein OEA41_003398 [Lepraria neglecta]